MVIKEFFRTKYRIKTDAYAGYEIQFRFWWMPFFVMDGINTYCSLERAQEKIIKMKTLKQVVYND